jgi:GDPmannose 4,6-dehydratase
MKTSLVTGIAGQDGSYLAELLISKGYRVVGAVRDVDRARLALPTNLRGSIDLVQWDMSDERLMRQILDIYEPVEFYNLAAYTSGAAMYDDPVAMGDVNGLAVTRMLGAIRIVNPAIRFCQASSREIFGEARVSPQTESTPPVPRSPYGAAKWYADAMVRIAREYFGLFACSAILFNHESPRRGSAFVTRKISCSAARIKLGLAKELPLGNLEARRDWGYAKDYVRAMWLMLQHNRADDYVVATGESHSVRDFCRAAFEHVGLDYRDFVREVAADYRPSEARLLVGDASKAWRELNWRPEVGFVELVHKMVDSDLQQLSVAY